MIKKLLCLWLPIAVVHAYRLQPAAFRGWAGSKIGVTRSTSHLAIPAIRAAGPDGGWAAFWSSFWSCGEEWK